MSDAVGFADIPDDCWTLPEDILPWWQPDGETLELVKANRRLFAFLAGNGLTRFYPLLAAPRPPTYTPLIEGVAP